MYYLYFHHCNDWVKTIPPSNIFLLSYSLKYFKRTQTSTTVLIRQLRLRYNKSNIKNIFCNKRLMAFLVSQISKDKPSRLLPIKNLLFWCGGLSSSYKKLCFFCKVLILYNCMYKSLICDRYKQRQTKCLFFLSEFPIHFIK